MKARPIESGAAKKLWTAPVVKIARLGLTATVYVLYFLLIVFFHDYTIAAIGLLVIVFVLAPLRAYICGKPTCLDILFDLASLPFQVLLVYGLISVCLFEGLWKWTPESWEWPMAGDSNQITFSDGRKAVLLNGLPRIQIYDATYRYADGWFVHEPKGRLSMYHCDPVNQGSNATFGVGSDFDVILYNLDGAMIETSKNDNKSMILAGGLTDEDRAAFKVHWYKWPLVSFANAFISLVIGLLGFLPLFRLRRFFTAGKNSPELLSK